MNGCKCLTVELFCGATMDRCKCFTVELFCGVTMDRCKCLTVELFCGVTMAAEFMGNPDVYMYSIQRLWNECDLDLY